MGLHTGTSLSVWLVSIVTLAFFGTTRTGFTYGLSDIANMILTSSNFNIFFFHHFHHQGIEPPLSLPYRFGIFFELYSVHTDRGADSLNIGDGSLYHLLMFSKNSD